MNYSSKISFLAALPILFLLMFNCFLVSAELYDAAALTLNLNYSGRIELKPTSFDSSLESVNAKLFFIPQKDGIETLSLKTSPPAKTRDDYFEFVWEMKEPSSLDYGAVARINTKLQRGGIKTKDIYPIKENALSQEVKEYLRASPLVDSTNQDIYKKANELKDGKQDLFEITTAMGWWVTSNVKYSLTTANIQATRSASWVLANREGVCDELTHLFIGLLRAAGIPARFVTGIAFTNDRSIKQPWGPHGWAEVYFPSTGWVAYDPTFSQYGWIDATHIPLRYGLDGAEPSVKLEWIGRNLDATMTPLRFDVTVEKESYKDETIGLQLIPISEVLGFGSDGVIKVKVLNQGEGYRAIVLSLAKVQQIEMIDPYSKIVLLAPNEEKEESWRFKVQKDLDTKARYEFPVMVYGDGNISDITSFFSDAEGKQVVVNNALDITARNELKNSDMECTPKKPAFNSGESVEIICTVNNPTPETKICGPASCVKAEKTTIYTISSTEPGEKITELKLFGTKQPGDVSVRYTINDPPGVAVGVINVPETMKRGENAKIQIVLSRTSYALPENVTIKVYGAWSLDVIQLDKVVNTEEIPVQISYDSIPMSKKLFVNVTWGDNQGIKYSSGTELEIGKDVSWYEWPGYAWMWTSEKVSGMLGIDFFGGR